MRIPLLFLASLSLFTISQPSLLHADTLSIILQQNAKSIERPSRRKIDATIKNLFASNVEGVPNFLKLWRDKRVWRRKQDGAFFFGPNATGEIEIKNIDTGKTIGTLSSRDFKQIKPNSGVRSVINSVLVQFQLQDPDPQIRLAAVRVLEQKGEAFHLKPLKESIASEMDSFLKIRKERIYSLLSISFGDDTHKRIEAIRRFDGDIGIDVRAALNPLLQKRAMAAKKLPANQNIARILRVGIELTVDQAYQLLVKSNLVPKLVNKADRDKSLMANIENGQIQGVPVSSLGDEFSRNKAYKRLADVGKAEPLLNSKEVATLVQGYVFYETYSEMEAEVTRAAKEILSSINKTAKINQVLDVSLDALSLASIYFLAAIGLAITFGVMRVINMAHGEFIMMGAYTGYVTQLFINNYTLSIIVALPLAFVITFLAGVLLERLVIRHLMHRPLETLLATFGISIALQQLAKNIFGSQAVPLTSPSWLDGSLVFNDIVSISYIRIAIFVLAAIFFALLLYTLNRTRFGLEVRAVTQNPEMASSMGINPDRINMLTFGLGSGIAGIAGIAIGLFAQVTSEIGSNYIVQSFMTVVVGGVGSVIGTLAGAGMIGSFQKAIEWFNPSNTLAAQTYMIIFIIIFIQFRPRGLITLKGRAAED